MGKKGYALVEAVTAVALVMMASGILSLGISFGLRMECQTQRGGCRRGERDKI